IIATARSMLLLMISQAASRSLALVASRLLIWMQVARQGRIVVMSPRGQEIVGEQLVDVERARELEVFLQDVDGLHPVLACHEPERTILGAFGVQERAHQLDLIERDVL